MVWNYMCISFFILLMSLCYHYYIYKPGSIVEYPKNRYDYIVVGAGTAGCVIASRLSEIPDVTVLLVEAGGYFNWFSSIPLAAPLLQGTDADWTYKTEPQLFSSRGLENRKQSWPRGKGLGGSGQMNYLVHSFGIPEDYENWPSAWSYSDLLPYFKRVQSKMNVMVASPEEPLVKAFLAAKPSLFLENVTFQRASSTIKKGARWTTYNAYLQSAWQRRNLHILINTIVTKVTLDDSSAARGIEIRHANGTIQKVEAKHEVILCGGAVNTPQLLMISGIGPAEELTRHQIPVLKNLSRVGKDLYDHLNVPLYVSLDSPVSITLNKMLSFTEILKYFIFGTGLFASNGIMANGRVDNSSIILFGMGSADEALLKEVANFQTETFRALFPSYGNREYEGFIFMSSCLQPQSRGNITLISSSIMDPPRIDPAYLEHDDDVVCTQRAIDLALKVLDTKPFRELGASVHLPYFKECRYTRQDYRDRDFSECVMRIAGLSSHHVGGTCKMGVGNDAIVDQQLRVKGVKGLRVIDASVLPSPLSGNPNSVIIAVAERAADLILATVRSNDYRDNDFNPIMPTIIDANVVVGTRQK